MVWVLVHVLMRVLLVLLKVVGVRLYLLRCQSCVGMGGGELLLQLLLRRRRRQ